MAILLYTGVSDDSSHGAKAPGSSHRTYLKIGARILTPDGVYGKIECIREHSIVVRFQNGWFKSYWIEK